MTETKETKVRIATRGSRLALWQAHWVRDALERQGCGCELVVVETQGDRQMVAFSAMQGQGFFTKAVQDAVLAGEADLAVHSLKDLPSEPFEGLEVTAIPCRADPRDVLLVRPVAYDPGGVGVPLVSGACVGTSAARRQAQLRDLRVDLKVQELRGNVPTRITKLREGDYDAIMLAAAGIERLELDVSDLQVVVLEPQDFLPAPGQGALALECRTGDTRVQAHVRQLHAPEVARAIQAERGLMRRFDGGCQLALGAHALIDPQTDELTLHAWYDGATASARHQDDEHAIATVFQMLTTEAVSAQEVEREG